MRRHASGILPAKAETPDDLPASHSAPVQDQSPGIRFLVPTPLHTMENGDTAHPREGSKFALMQSERRLRQSTSGHRSAFQSSPEWDRP